MFMPRLNVRLIFFASLICIDLTLLSYNIIRARQLRTEFPELFENDVASHNNNYKSVKEDLPKLSTKSDFHKISKAPEPSQSSARKLFDFNFTNVTRAVPELSKIRGKKELQLKSTNSSASLGAHLKQIVNCHDRGLEMQKEAYGEYWVIRNFISGTISRSVGCADTITYTANGDYTFFESLPFVIKSWLAPISFALYTPGFDIYSTMDSIQYARNCLNESDLIKQYVSFHLFFPRTHMPTFVPLVEDEALSWPYECTTEAPYVHVNRSEMYKTQSNLTYPINVGRNIARKSVNTHFIFACDIELIPSRGLAQQFLEMVAHNQSVLYGGATKSRVFPMPVFELAENAKIPATKAELKRMLQTKQAIPFHSKICKECHLVPDQAKWLNATEHNNEMTVLSVGKRQGKFKYWEPFYISDNHEPLFDERITWEGQSNKRIQGYAMCLLNYEYHVIHPAFLVHMPGIKVFNKKSKRLQYVKSTNRLIKLKIQPEYMVLYGERNGCYV